MRYFNSLSVIINVLVRTVFLNEPIFLKDFVRYLKPLTRIVIQNVINIQIKFPWDFVRYISSLLLVRNVIKLHRFKWDFVRYLKSLTTDDWWDSSRLEFCLASLFFFLWSGFDSMIISSNSYVGSQFRWSFYKTITFS